MAFYGILFPIGILCWLPVGISTQCITTALSNASHTIRVDCRHMGLKNIPVNLTAHDVVELLLDFNYIGPFLKADQLHGFDRLKKLTLGNNYIQSVDSDAFYGLPALEHLSLFENGIPSLDRDSFKHCSNLKFLNIGANLFTELPGYLFQHLPLLEVIKMQEISYPDAIAVKKLPSGFNSSARLTNLTMTSFSMNTITRDFFDNIQNQSALIHLDFAANSIISVDPQAFDGFDNLANLTLNLNNHMSTDNFNNMLYGLRNSKLKYLSCYFCEGLHYINKTTFSWLNNSGLQILWLTSSNIVTIDLYSFKTLVDLEELHLDDSRVSVYELGLFAGLENSLAYIDISDNEFLQDITWSIANLTHLTYVDVSGNPQLGGFYANAMAGLHLVEYLYFYNCDLKVVHNESFQEMHSLKMLDLSQNNKLYRLDGYAFKRLYNVTELYVDDTTIEGLHEEQFVDMPLMTVLSASATNVKHLPNNLFRNNTQLTQVVFTGNKIEYVNKTFQHMQHLHRLDLDGNAIEGFSNDSFFNCSKLTYLDISTQNNGKSPLICYIPKTIIKHLNKTLITLYVGSNNITVFNHTELNFFENSSLENIFLEKNPYNCSCMMLTGKLFYNFVLWFNKTKKIPKRTTSLYSCMYSNKKQQGQHMQRFNFQALCILPFDPMPYIIGVPTSVVLTAMLVSLVTYRKRWSIRYYMFKLKRLLMVLEDEDIKMLNPKYEYDAYISHGNSNHHTVTDVERQDYHFILEYIIPEMSKNNQCRPFRFSTDFMGFLLGHDHLTQINEFMNISRKVIILLTKSYLSSPLGAYELERAYSYQADAHVDNLIILLLLEAVPINANMPEELKSALKHEKYIEWTDNPDGRKLFWESLQEALVNP